MSRAWDMLAPHQQEAAKAAARLIEQAELQFMMMLFSAGGVGAVIGNIEPVDAVRLIEGALMAAKTTESYAEIDMGRPN
jgi:dihydroxyacetone kinase DhaKLM complex PTS-EIIA-like component DhaM